MYIAKDRVYICVSATCKTPEEAVKELVYVQGSILDHIDIYKKTNMRVVKGDWKIEGRE